MTFEEIIGLPGNKRAYEILVELLNEQRPIAFVGAGASAGMYPLWPQLIDQLADYTFAEGKASEEDASRWKADRDSPPEQRVNVIVRKLGEDPYRAFLKNTFSARRGSDGKRFTPIHAALLRLPFRGYVTTNYDPGLEFARAEIRPDCLTSGTPTWEDDTEVHNWSTGDVFADGACPILWLHGFWQRPNGIVLNSGSYSRAYKPGPYKRAFEELWARERLVFLGFGFKDPRFTFLVGELLRDFAEAGSEARHIAIMGFPLEVSKEPDFGLLDDMRSTQEADYHVRPLFYPVVGDDHSALALVLAKLEGSCARGMTPAVSSAPAPAGPRSLVSKWVHETSDDEIFGGREDEIGRLNRWVADHSVRVLGVSAIGGTGKTALAGHWLKKTDGWRTRQFRGIFGWSFYRNQHVTAFLTEFLQWARVSIGVPISREAKGTLGNVIAVLRKERVIVVLDGLEVQQEGPDGSLYGELLDGDLRELLVELCSDDANSLAILTSRFAFRDLERFLGTSFRQLELHGLTGEQGAKLLKSLGVGGSSDSRAAVSVRVDGHPLALRLFSEAISPPDRGDPLRFLEFAFSVASLNVSSPLNDRIRRLLGFYERRLSPNQVRTLSVVALFRAPVTERTIFALCRGLFSNDAEGPLGSDAELLRCVRSLHTQGILTREPVDGDHGYACHPILRDYFRASLLARGSITARKTADLLSGTPSAATPSSLADIEPVLLAIEVLLDAELFNAADELYVNRLHNGRVFLFIPARAQGLACALGFVRNNLRRQLCESMLSLRHLAFFLNEVVILATSSGRLDVAAEFLADSVKIHRQEDDKKNLAACLRNLSDLDLQLGRIEEAEQAAQESLSLSSNSLDRSYRNALVHLGHAEALAGRVTDSAETFTFANAVEQNIDSERKGLYGLRGVRWARLLLDCGHRELAQRLLKANLAVCERNGWKDDVARCLVLLAESDSGSSQDESAPELLDQAERIFRTGGMAGDLADTQLAAARLLLARNLANEALGRAEAALDISAPRGMRLVHAAALVLRARAKLLRGSQIDVEWALDDCEDALHIARDCAYPWAERDALGVKAEALGRMAKSPRSASSPALKDRYERESRSARQDADAISRSLDLTQRGLQLAEFRASVKINDLLKQWK